MSMEATSDSFPPKLTTKYMVSQELGKGACGEVSLGVRVPDLHRVAIKITCKCTIVNTFDGGDSSCNVLNKVWILYSVNHRCIIKDVIYTPNFLYIVLELAEGVELFDKIIEKSKLHFLQIALAIKYLQFKKSVAQTVFKASALWADAFYKSICPYVCLCVCLSVHF